MPAKILVDMNLSPAWCSMLNRAGLTAVHWSAIGRGGAPDREIMSYAETEGFTVLTHDLDFGAILAATGGTLPSVVQIRAKDVSPAVIGSKVLSAPRQLQNELAAGALVTVDADRTRLRLLPLLRRDDHDSEDK